MSFDYELNELEDNIDQLDREIHMEKDFQFKSTVVMLRLLAIIARRLFDIRENQ